MHYPKHRAVLPVFVLHFIFSWCLVWGWFVVVGGVRGEMCVCACVCVRACVSGEGPGHVMVNK